jgi:hypothetical protein
MAMGSCHCAAALRWMRSLPLLSAGAVSVVAGGMAAAVTGPLQWSHGSWVAAFLVLVAGVTQLGIGAGQAQLSATSPTVAFVAAQCGLWNVGCATVITGTLLSSPLAVAAGSAPLMAVFVMSVAALKGQSGSPRSVVLVGYRLLLLVVLASVPIGIALAFARS